MREARDVVVNSRVVRTAYLCQNYVSKLAGVSVDRQRLYAHFGHRFTPCDICHTVRAIQMNDSLDERVGIEKTVARKHIESRGKQMSRHITWAHVYKFM